MSIPEAVKKQVEEAERLAKEALESAPQETQADDELPEQEVDTLPEQQEEHEQKPQEKTEDWEHKYRVLQGKYNAEVPRLHDELRAKSQELEYLRGKLELLEQVVTKQLAKEEQQQPQTDETIENFKETFPDIYAGVERLIKQYMDSVSKVVEEKVKPVEEKTKQVSQSAFVAQLTQLAPNWATLNTDQRFLDWLQEKERFSGMTKHELLMMAYNRGDVQAVANFFNTFEAEMANEKPTQSTQSTIAPPVGKPRTVSTVGRSSGKIYTESEIKDFYKKVALGRISQSEKERIERDIIKAMQEGRIINK